MTELQVKSGIFSPKSKKVHMDIDPSSFNKSVNADLLIQGDLTKILGMTLKIISENKITFSKIKLLIGGSKLKNGDLEIV